MGTGGVGSNNLTTIFVVLDCGVIANSAEWDIIRGVRFYRGVAFPLWAAKGGNVNSNTAGNIIFLGVLSAILFAVVLCSLPDNECYQAAHTAELEPCIKPPGQPPWELWEVPPEVWNKTPDCRLPTPPQRCE